MGSVLQFFDGDAVNVGGVVSGRSPCNLHRPQKSRAAGWFDTDIFCIVQHAHKFIKAGVVYRKISGNDIAIHPRHESRRTCTGEAVGFCDPVDVKVSHAHIFISFRRHSQQYRRAVSRFCEETMDIISENPFQPICHSAGSAAYACRKIDE